MRRPNLLQVAALSAFCFNLLTTQAQTTTSELDLGRIKVQKEFTQSITIKGEDLRKMSYSSLSEAINVWLYGVFTNSTSLVYAIDGNVVNDVDAYSINDIEEIVLVQNALTAISGTMRQQVLLAITTKKGGEGKSGITASAQSNLLVQKPGYESDLVKKSDVSMFNQLYLSGYKNTEKARFQISANYLRDTDPMLKYDGIKEKDVWTIGRFRFRGTADYRLSKRINVFVDVNYSPQKESGSYAFDNNEPFVDQSNKAHVFNSSLKLKTTLADGLTNTVDFTFNDFKTDNDYLYGFRNTLENRNSHIFLLRENLSWLKRVANWQIEPSVNFNFRYTNWFYKNSTTTEQNNDPQTYSYSSFNSSAYDRAYFLTPSMRVSNLKVFNFQGGILFNLSDYDGVDRDRAFPFASTTFDLIKLANAESKSSLKLYGSYAKLPGVTNSQVRLNGMTNLDPETYFNDGYYFNYLALMPDENYSVFQLGTSFGLLNERLSLNYSYDKRDIELEIYDVVTQNYVRLSGLDANNHAFKLSANAIDNKSFKWFSAVSLASLYIKSDFLDRSWSGGWVNRLNMGRFTGELDLATWLKTRLGNSNNYNSLNLQNVALGVKLNKTRLGTGEFFVNSRNLIQNKKSNLTDGRRFYGLGVRFDLNR